MHAIVTGVTGFIGEHLAESLLDSGHQVTGISRQDDPTLKFSDRSDFELVTADLCSDSDKLGSLLPDQVDIVYHYAARISNDCKFNKYLRGNVLATYNILNYSKDRAKIFVQASTGSVYSWDNKDLFIDEETPENPYTEYGLSKYLADIVVQSQATHCDISACILRYSVVYGYGQSQNFLGDIYRKILANERIQMPTEVAEREIDIIHVNDVVSATTSIPNHNPKELDGELFLVASGKSNKIIDIVRSIIRETESDSEIEIKDNDHETLPNIYWDVSKSVDELDVSKISKHTV